MTCAKTATVLSGTVYHLLTNPAVYQTLTEEIRGTFKSQDQLTIGTLQNMKYLNACLEEGLRIFPPAPVALPRVSPQGGATVCGRFVPEGVSNFSVLTTAALYCTSTTFTDRCEDDRWCLWLGG